MLQLSIDVTPNGFWLATVNFKGAESQNEDNENGGTGDKDGDLVQGYFHDSVPKAITL